MKGEIFISDFNEEVNKTLVVEGDEHTIWAYVLNSLDGQNNIEFQGFLCSRGTLVEEESEIGDYIDQGFAPPLLRSFSNEYSVQEEITANNISIFWDKEKVGVLVDEVTYLILDYTNKVAYSKGVLEESPYGRPLMDFVME